MLCCREHEPVSNVSMYALRAHVRVAGLTEDTVPNLLPQLLVHRSVAGPLECLPGVLRPLSKIMHGSDVCALQCRVKVGIRLYLCTAYPATCPVIASNPHPVPSEHPESPEDLERQSVR
jgi:hypothetical protein